MQIIFYFKEKAVSLQPETDHYTLYIFAVLPHIANNNNKSIY